MRTDQISAVPVTRSAPGLLARLNGHLPLGKAGNGREASKLGEAGQASSTQQWLRL
ncbi:hypothetical protein [Paenibacillus sambharensis]|uniref:hypothetical protein n=1 Tax=Paenibacillus sambharensis TaxID=1803190 RepID=UPI0015E8B384|nr:hypothetical protein [Paenibacillus sambharensis]